eukprot:929046-Amphidinium_carterae.1
MTNSQRFWGVFSHFSPFQEKFKFSEVFQNIHGPILRLLPRSAFAKFWGRIGTLRDTIGTLRDTPGTLQGHSGTLPGHSRDTPGTLRDTPGTLQGHSGTLPGHSQDTPATLACQFSF